MCWYSYSIFSSMDSRVMYGYNSIFSCCHLDSQPMCYNTSSNMESDQVSRQKLLEISCCKPGKQEDSGPQTQAIYTHVQQSTQSVAICPIPNTVTPHLLLCQVTKVRALTQSFLWKAQCLYSEKAEDLLPNENLGKRLPKTFQLYTNSLFKMVLFKLFIAHING